MIAVGIDTVDIARFRRLLARRPQADRACSARGSGPSWRCGPIPVPGFAARFAAKEATMKALGTGLGGVRFSDVEVVGGGSQAPRLAITGLAARRARELGVGSWHVSLTHTDALAMAVVVAD